MQPRRKAWRCSVVLYSCVPCYMSCYMSPAASTFLIVLGLIMRNSAAAPPNSGSNSQRPNPISVSQQPPFSNSMMMGGGGQPFMTVSCVRAAVPVDGMPDASASAYLGVRA